MTIFLTSFYILEDGYLIGPQSFLFQTKQTHVFQTFVMFLKLLAVFLLLPAL